MASERLNVRLTGALHRQATERAKSEGATLTSRVVALLEDYVRDREPASAEAALSNNIAALLGNHVRVAGGLQPAARTADKAASPVESGNHSTLNMRIDAALHAKASQYAEDEGRGLSDKIRELLHGYVNMTDDERRLWEARRAIDRVIASLTAAS